MEGFRDMKRLFLAIFLLAPSVCHAASLTTGLVNNTHWEQDFFGMSGAVYAVEFDRTIPGRVYAGSDVSGFWISTDYGEHWKHGGTSLTCAEVSNIYQDSFGRIFVACGEENYTTSGGLWMSEDRGATFTQLNTNRVDKGIGIKSIAVDSSDSNKIYYAEANTAFSVDGDLHYSSDGGQTWSTPLDDPFGASTTIQGIQLASDNIHLFVHHKDNTATSYLRVYDVRDWSYSEITLTSTMAEYLYDSDTYTLNGTQYVCFGAGQKVACTSDNGASFTYSAEVVDGTKGIYRIDTKVIDGAVYMAVATCALNGTYLDAYSSEDFYYSSNGGTSWTDFDNSDICDATSISDGSLHLNSTRCELSNTGRSISINPFDKTMILSGNSWSILKSTNSGTNYYARTKGLGNTVVTRIREAPNGDLYASGMDFGLARRVRGDNGWHIWDILVPNATYDWPDWTGHFWDFTLSEDATHKFSEGTGIINVGVSDWDSSGTYPEATGKMFKSTDSGATWSSSVPDGFPIGKQTTGVATPFYSYAKPIEMGQSADGNQLYVWVDGTAYGAFVSTDIGDTWVKSGGTPSGTNGQNVFRGFAVDPTDTDGSTIVLIGWLNTNSQYSTDSGENWSDMSGTDLSYCKDAEFNPSTGYIYAGRDDRNNIYYGTNYDNGMSTELVDLDDMITTGCTNDGSPMGLTFDPDNAERMAFSLDACDGPLIVYTEDLSSNASASWQDITGDFPIPQGCLSMLFDGEVLYCASTGGGVYHLDMEKSYNGRGTNITATNVRIE